MRKSITVFGLLCGAVLMMGDDCQGQKTSTQVERQQQERSSLQAQQAVGMPAITRFSEKALLKDIYELRDKMNPTTTYIMALDGHLIKVCDSFGYGVPYATEFTNPQKAVYAGGEGVAAIAQADPNGLYSPSSAEGTWVLCLNPKTAKSDVVYIEPRIIVSPFPIEGK